MCAKYSLPPFDWLKLSHHLVSGESTLHEVTLFEARSRIFLPTAESCAALFYCRLAIRASSLGWLVGNKYVPPHRAGLLHRFGLKTGIHFAHFGLESSVIFEGTAGVCERFYRFNSK